MAHLFETATESSLTQTVAHITDIEMATFTAQSTVETEAI